MKVSAQASCQNSGRSPALTPSKFKTIGVWLRGLWLERQTGLSAESVDELGSVLDALEQPLGAHGELVDDLGEQIAQVALDVRPHALGGVELAGVGRQLDHGQPVGARVAEPTHGGAAVHVPGCPKFR